MDLRFLQFSHSRTHGTHTQENKLADTHIHTGRNADIYKTYTCTYIQYIYTIKEKHAGSHTYTHVQMKHINIHYGR